MQQSRLSRDLKFHQNYPAPYGFHQRITSARTGEVSYRAQVRVKGRPTQSANFPNRKEAKAWADSIEFAIREGRHFPHAAARRTTFDALAQDYVQTILAEFDAKERHTRVRQLAWWSRQFAGLSLVEITAVHISKARDALSVETFSRGRPQVLPNGEIIAPKAYRRAGATANRYIATLSHALSFAVKERRLLERNPVSDISRKKEGRGRTRFLTDGCALWCSSRLPRVLARGSLRACAGRKPTLCLERQIAPSQHFGHRVGGKKLGRCALLRDFPCGRLDAIFAGFEHMRMGGLRPRAADACIPVRLILPW